MHVQGAGFEGVARDVSSLAVGLIALMGIALVATSSVAVEPGYPVAINIQNASAKVGAKAVIMAKITIGDGFRVTDSYGHRLSGLSAPDDGVEIERRLVRGAVQDSSIVFAVVVTPKRAGTHSVSGLFRFSYHNGQELDIRSARFDATVTGTE